MATAPRTRRAALDFSEREAYIDTVRYRNTGPVPLVTMGPRESTIRAWTEQGLPPGAPWLRTLLSDVGIPYPEGRCPRVDLGINLRMVPTFEEKVLEHRNGHYIVQDWMGNITEISDAFDLTYLRSAKDFVTRKWHSFPVTDRASFKEMKRRYDPDEPTRFSSDFDERVRSIASRDWMYTVGISGPFWQLREWCGFEPLCMLFLDDPTFVAEMVEFWSDFGAAMLDRIFSRFVPDKLHMSEDMAYKGASMISPAMAREFLLPVWKRWTAMAKQAGVPVVDMDSDGKVDELIPLWIEAGIEECDPIEVAAGCDVVAYRDRFERRIAYSGGIDKRAMAAGGAVLDAEIDRIAPVVRGGGYIPGCDHGIPSDVSWANMHHFVRRWAEITGWA
jgi:uroporphyrinogen-III decarboxylase